MLIALALAAPMLLHRWVQQGPTRHRRVDAAALAAALVEKARFLQVLDRRPCLAGRARRGSRETTHPIAMTTAAAANATMRNSINRRR